MKCYFTRWTFKPRKHYTGCLPAQGRVRSTRTGQAERLAAHRKPRPKPRRDRPPAGAPVDHAVFLLTVVSNKLQISKGLAYCGRQSLGENEQDLALDAQPGKTKKNLRASQLPTAAPGMSLGLPSPSGCGNLTPLRRQPPCWGISRGADTLNPGPRPSGSENLSPSPRRGGLGGETRPAVRH